MFGGGRWFLSGSVVAVVALAGWVFRRDHVIIVENRSAVHLDKVSVSGGGERREVAGVSPHRHIAIKLRALGDGTFTVEAESKGKRLRSGSCGYHGGTGSAYVNIAIDEGGVMEASCKWGPIR